MAGTSTPFFLYPTGSTPAVTRGGVRSLFAFWMGGASSTANAPPPPVTQVVWSGGGYEHRKPHSHSLRESLDRALVAVHKAQKKTDSPEVAIVAETIRHLESAVEVKSYAKDLNEAVAALVRANRLMDSAKKLQADTALRQAAHMAMLIQNEIAAREADDEEAIALLLLH